MKELKHRFPQINKGGLLSYGGDQGSHPRKQIQKYGCGIVSSVDLLLYLHLYRKGCQSSLFDDCRESGVTLSRYNEWVSAMNRKYLPVIPGFGINGLSLVIGLNRYFRRNEIPFRARWCVSRRKLWQRMDEMLSKDLPVIFSAGPNFPLFWGKNSLRLYARSGEDYRQVNSVRAHYMTATAADDEWVQLSSWGRKYYINKKEYESYAKNHSSFIISNLVLLKPDFYS